MMRRFGVPVQAAQVTERLRDIMHVCEKEHGPAGIGCEGRDGCDCGVLVDEHGWVEFDEVSAKKCAEGPWPCELPLQGTCAEHPKQVERIPGKRH